MEADSKRVLITGATGFIGGRLARACLRVGHRVRVLARDPRRAAELGDVEIVTGDLLRPETLEGVARGVERVVHCASLLGKWGTREERLRELNVGGTENLLRACAGERIARFVHLSAGGVTGPVPAREVDEGWPCRPATPYERTKLEAERRVLELSAALGVPATVVRPTFTYGPGDPHKLALFRAVQRGRYLFIDGGRSVNHPVHVDDLVDGILRALERARPGEVYIIGGERPVTKRELVETIARAVGAPAPRRSVPRWVAWPAAVALEGLGRALGFEPILTRSRVMMMADNFGYSIGKARDELGYEPRVGLDQGIRDTVESYRRAGRL